MNNIFPMHRVSLSTRRNRWRHWKGIFKIHLCMLIILAIYVDLFSLSNYSLTIILVDYNLIDCDLIHWSKKRKIQKWFKIFKWCQIIKKLFKKVGFLQNFLDKLPYQRPILPPQSRVNNLRDFWQLINPPPPLTVAISCEACTPPPIPSCVRGNVPSISLGDCRPSGYWNEGAKCCSFICYKNSLKLWTLQSFHVVWLKLWIHDVLSVFQI